MIHMYTGDGKGKTCMAVGQAVRFAGWGGSVFLIQFLKPGIAGELKAFQNLPNIRVICHERAHDFVFRLDAEEREALKSEIQREYAEALKLVQTIREQVMLVLDEFLDVVSMDLISRQQAIDLLCYNDNIEIVVTGHQDQGGLLELADYHSEVRMIKHPYTKGIKARKGIDY